MVKNSIIKYTIVLRTQRNIVYFLFCCWCCAVKFFVIKSNRLDTFLRRPRDKPITIIKSRPQMKTVRWRRSQEPSVGWTSPGWVGVEEEESAVDQIRSNIPSLHWPCDWLFPLELFANFRDQRMTRAVGRASSIGNFIRIKIMSEGR